MPSVRAFLLSLLTVIPLLGADLPEWFEPFDADAVRVDVERARIHSVHVAGVFDDSPAQRAGLQQGLDFIVALDGIRVYDRRDYAGIRWFFGDTTQPLQLDVLREGSLLPFRIVTRIPRSAGVVLWAPRALDGEFLPTYIDPDGSLASDRAARHAWQQLPGKHRHTLMTWVQQADPHADRAWIAALFAKWTALCQQDFAAAASIPIPKPPVLTDFALFLDRLAQRHAKAEQDPDPTACGVDVVTFVAQYPWPDYLGPALGNVGLPAYTAHIDLLRRTSWVHSNRQEYLATKDLFDRCTTNFPAECLPHDPMAKAFLLKYMQGLLWGADESLWPSQRLREDPQHLPAVIDHLRGEIAARPAENSAWLVMAEICATYDRVALQRGPTDRFAKTLRDLEPRFRLLKAQSPWLAWKTLAALRIVSMRAHAPLHADALRELCESLDLWPCEKPSRLLKYLNERTYFPYFRFEPTSTWDDDYPFLAANLLAQPIAREDLDRGLKALTPTSDLAHTAALIDAWVIAQLPRLTVDAIVAIDPMIVGTGLGFLVDRVPDLVKTQFFNWSDWHATDALRRMLLAERIDYDLAAIHAGLHRIDTTPPADVRQAIEDLRLRHGSFIATLVLADACSTRGLDDVAKIYRATVQRAYDAIFASMRDARWHNFDQSTSHWQALMTYASSPATADLAIKAGEFHLKFRRDRDAWTCSHLSMAQARLVQNDLPAVVHHLVESFTGVESKGTEGFVIAGTVIRGEPRMRTWLITQLAQAKALDPAACARITQAAKPGYLEDEALALLGATADTVGQPAAGDNDF